MQQTERGIQMIIKMANKFKLTGVHFGCPNPMQICACTSIYRWTQKNWVPGPSGCQAIGPSHRRGPLGLRATRLWATGLLLAKPFTKTDWFRMVK